jgi:hypothetical protein
LLRSKSSVRLGATVIVDLDGVVPEGGRAADSVKRIPMTAIGRMCIVSDVMTRVVC